MVDISDGAIVDATRDNQVREVDGRVDGFQLILADLPWSLGGTSI